MRAVIQRVRAASVRVNEETIGSICSGLLLLVGVARDDTETDALALAQKIAGLRIFSDERGHMNFDATDVGGEVLVVSQFTLYADVTRGRRPSFTGAASPDLAEPLIEVVASTLEELGLVVSRGRFGAMMEVELVNQGPVTIVLETKGGRFVGPG